MSDVDVSIGFAGVPLGDWTEHAACPVRVDCLAFAIANDERYGVWGGASINDRRRIRRAARR